MYSHANTRQYVHVRGVHAHVHLQCTVAGVNVHVVSCNVRTCTCTGMYVGECLI